MASIINASSTGSGGIVQTADASGVLQLQTNGSVALAVSTTRNITITSTGATGLTLDTDSSATGNSSRLFFMNVTNGVSLRSSNASTDGQLIFSTAAAPDSTSGTARVYFNKFGVGLAAIPSSGTGISFPSAQDPSSDANTLDDYEEGTFTPSYSGGLTGVSYGSVRNGYYRKIGSQVTIWLGIMTSGLTVTASGLTVSGLPFTATNSGGSNGTLNINNGTRWLSSPPTTGTVEPNTTSIILYNNIGSLGSGDDPVQVVTSNMETGGSNQNILFATATYIATA